MSDLSAKFLERLRVWPRPALGAWVAGWLILQICLGAGVGSWPAIALGWLPSWLIAQAVPGRWRRVLLLGGWPTLVGMATVADWPGWIWLGASGCLLLLYPLSAWRDAPFFPTPRGALTGLSRRIRLREGALVLDAGSGLGHGLVALRQAFPRARIEGIERSGLLVLACRLRRTPGVRTRRGDLWSVSWREYDLVYLFQRPESMEPAWRKARAEMRPGTWLVSLEFPVPGLTSTFELDGGAATARRVLVYRLSE